MSVLSITSVQVYALAQQYQSALSSTCLQLTGQQTYAPYVSTFAHHVADVVGSTQTFPVQTAYRSFVEAPTLDSAAKAFGAFLSEGRRIATPHTLEGYWQTFHEDFAGYHGALDRLDEEFRMYRRPYATSEAVQRFGPAIEALEEAEMPFTIHRRFTMREVYDSPEVLIAKSVLAQLSNAQAGVGMSLVFDLKEPTGYLNLPEDINSFHDERLRLRNIFKSLKYYFVTPQMSFEMTQIHFPDPFPEVHVQDPVNLLQAFFEVFRRGAATIPRLANEISVQFNAERRCFEVRESTGSLADVFSQNVFLFGMSVFAVPHHNDQRGGVDILAT